MRRAAKKDGNHEAIASGLRALGWYVMDLSRAGYGVPDILVAKPATERHRGICVPVEIKSPGGQLTEAEVTVKNAWDPCDYIVADSLESALQQLAALMLKGNL